MRVWKHKRLLIVVSVLACAAWWWMQAPRAAADSYPYPDTPCIWAPYAVQGTTANWCPDYDFGAKPHDESAANVISPYGYYYRNCTDYTAWKVSSLGVPEVLYKGLGNAKDWAARAALKGLRVDNIPAVGAVGVRTTGAYGHTAYVEVVEGEVITVSQYNHGADGNYSEQSGTPTQLELTLFVHFEDVMPPQVPVVVPEAPVVAEPIVSEAPAELAGEVETVAVETAEVLAAQTETAVQATSVAEQEAAPEPPAPEPEPAAAVAAVAPPSTQQAQATPPPAPLVWRQADRSPPAVQVASVAQQPAAIHIAAKSDVAINYWPLMGLFGALLLHEAWAGRYLHKRLK